MIDKQTQQFYQTRAEEWASHLPHDVAPRLDPFLDLLPSGSSILDLGCGDGRDAQHMEQRGFAVDATDGVSKMVELSSQRLKRPSRRMLFEELEADAEYDAVWAHASLLHVPTQELPGILTRVWRSLKPGGWHFSAFKGGEGGARDKFGRFYSYIPEEALQASYQVAGEWAQFSVETTMGGSYGGGPTPWHNVTAQKVAPQ